MTYQEYYKEIESIVEQCWSDYDDQTENEWLDSLHEQLDGHEYVIYYANQFDALKHSSNENYGFENGLMAEKFNNLNDVLMSATYWAMYADSIEYFEYNKTEIMEGK